MICMNCSTKELFEKYKSLRVLIYIFIICCLSIVINAMPKILCKHMRMYSLEFAAYQERGASVGQKLRSSQAFMTKENLRLLRIHLKAARSPCTGLNYACVTRI